MFNPSQDERFKKLIVSIPHLFRNKHLLKCAVSVQSAPYSFSHLEVVGDSILNMVVKTQLALQNPDWDAGKITLHSQHFLKNTGSTPDDKSVLMSIAENIGLSEYFEKRCLYKGKWGKAHTLSSAVEAIIAAVYYDSEKNIEKAQKFILMLMTPFDLSESEIAMPRRHSV